MAMRLFDAAGRPISLGREIARGGEGAVLDVTHDPQLVAKVYHNRVDPEKIQKLEAMARIGTPPLMRIAAWPIGTLHDAPRGELVGILLPKISSYREIHELYSPAQRRVHYPKADWEFIIHVSMNCAAAFETVHSLGHVIGDVNQSGLLVSHNGMIKLIDCDSFQIQVNGRLFRCVVGVPQFTPPELQAQSSFRRLDRTPEHDCFGLALVIFHLLFMGRHPFAGRYHGAGDMPIEKAIAEGRFAFSRLSQSYQMTPPPHSLPVSALPPLIVDMFERGFARPSAGVSRPAAHEWRQALSGLKLSLRKCGIDAGHRYPNHLNACPWCEIARAGGPNFFVSVQIIAGGHKFDLPPIDVSSLWARIESVPRPAFTRPSTTVRRVFTPHPIPPALAEQGLFLRLVKIVCFVAVAIAASSPAVGFIAGYIGGGLLLVFGVWWAVLEANSGYKREVNSRREECDRLRRAIADQFSQWERIATRFTYDFDARKSDLFRLTEEASRLSGQFEAERRQLEAKKRELQFHAFLDRHFIRDYKIPKVGLGRLATLVSYGIETAADVDADRLDALPGFGAVIVAELLAWQNMIASRFRFDPRKQIPATELQAIVIRYRQTQQAFESRLENGREELLAIVTAAQNELTIIQRHIEQLAPRYAQAVADARLR